MRKGMGMVLLLAGIGWVAASPAAQASCTVSLVCTNGCSEHLECGISGLVISCSAPAQTVSCSGATSCSTGTNSVTCDGTATLCKTVASRCAKDAVSIRCDATFKQCPTCGGKVCQSSPQPAPDFWSAPSDAGAAPAGLAGTTTSAACF